jgi:hypothetical protein
MIVACGNTGCICHRQESFAAEKERRHDLELFNAVYPSLAGSKQAEVQRLVRNEGRSIRKALEAVGVMCL